MVQVGDVSAAAAALAGTDSRWRPVADRVADLVAAGHVSEAGAELAAAASGLLPGGGEESVAAAVGLAGLLDDTSGKVTSAVVDAAGPKFADAGRLAVLSVRLDHGLAALTESSARVEELSGQVAAARRGLRTADARRVAVEKQLVAEQALRESLSEQVGLMGEQVSQLQVALSAVRGERDAAREQAAAAREANVAPDVDTPDAAQQGADLGEPTPEAGQQASGQQPADPDVNTSEAGQQAATGEQAPPSPVVASTDVDWMAAVLQAMVLADGPVTVDQLAGLFHRDPEQVESALVGLRGYGVVADVDGGAVTVDGNADDAFAALFAGSDRAGAPAEGKGAVEDRGAVPKALGQAAVAAGYNIKYWGEGIEPYLVDGSKPRSMLDFLAALEASPDTAAAFFSSLSRSDTVWFQQRLMSQRPAMAGQKVSGSEKEVRNDMRRGVRAARRSAITVDKSLDSDMFELYHPEALKGAAVTAGVGTALITVGPAGSAAAAALLAVGAIKGRKAYRELKHEMRNMTPWERVDHMRLKTSLMVGRLRSDFVPTVKAMPRSVVKGSVDAAKAGAAAATYVPRKDVELTLAAAQKVDAAGQKVAAAGQAAKRVVKSRTRAADGPDVSAAAEVPGYNKERSRSRV